MRDIPSWLLKFHYDQQNFRSLVATELIRMTSRSHFEDQSRHFKTSGGWRMADTGVLRG
jgi:hypothetical protein